MKRLAVILCLLSSTAWPQSMMVGVDRADAGAAYVGPGNIVSGAQFYGGLRAYNQAWAVAHNKLARVCTPSDATCDDVNSDSSGNFNIAASLVSACNNSTTICTVKTLYDQSGANNCTGGVPCDLTQATEASRPKLVVAGGCPSAMSATRPCMFNGTFNNGVNLTAANQFVTGSAQPWVIFIVYYNPTRDGDESMFGSSNFTIPSMFSGFSGANRATIVFGSTFTVTTGVNDAVWHANIGIFDDLHSLTNLVIDGTSNTGSIGSGSYTTLQLQLFNSGASSFSGYIVEVAQYPLGFNSTQWGNMNTNIHTYWGF